MIDIIIAFFVGFIAGNVFGIVLMALMAVSSRDSRQREEMEEKEQTHDERPSD